MPDELRPRTDPDSQWLGKIEAPCRECHAYLAINHGCRLCLGDHCGLCRGCFEDAAALLLAGALEIAYGPGAEPEGDDPDVSLAAMNAASRCLIQHALCEAIDAIGVWSESEPEMVPEIVAWLRKPAKRR